MYSDRKIMRPKVKRVRTSTEGFFRRKPKHTDDQESVLKLRNAIRNSCGAIMHVFSPNMAHPVNKGDDLDDPKTPITTRSTLEIGRFAYAMLKDLDDARDEITDDIRSVTAFVKKHQKTVGNPGTLPLLQKSQKPEQMTIGDYEHYARFLWEKSREMAHSYLEVLSKFHIPRED